MSEPTHNQVSLAAIVLAAGKGTRMKSKTPKVLHKVCGRPMVERILGSLHEAGVRQSCLVVSEAYSPLAHLIGESTVAVIQHQRLGTGEAVAASALAFDGQKLPKYAKSTLIGSNKLSATHVLVCAGDTPALSAPLLLEFLEAAMQSQAKLALIGIRLDQPFGYGRLVCEPSGHLKEIVEEKDADDLTKQITLCNSGVIFAESDFLFSCLEKLECNNQQEEYYLTDCFKIAAQAGEAIYVHETSQSEAFFGVNDRQQLAQIETWLVNEKRQQLMKAGVSIRLPETCYIEDSVEIANDVEIGSHCSITGKTRIASGAVIGSHSSLHNAQILEDSKLSAYTVISNP